jgi:N-acetylneuraminic acid mutarotase
LFGEAFIKGMTTSSRSGIAGLALLVVAAVTNTVAVPAAGSPWSQAAWMAQSRLAATATLLPNGKVLVVGGGQLNPGAELYDPIADRWLPTGPMVIPRALATATTLPSGKVLIAGGITADTGHSTTRAEIYDPASNSWSAADGMAVQRSSHVAALLPSGKVLVAGGQNASGYIATAELYDPVSNRWTMAARMDAGYTGARAALLANGTVLVVGGATFGDGRGELYDPGTDRWSNAGTEARIAETATLLTNGKVLITGPGREADLYDPATNRWSLAAPMLQDRVDPRATALADGRVLVTGGTTTTSGRQRWLSSAEIYDPAVNRWSPAGCMGQPRWEQAAVLLPTKRVLIAGGSGASLPLSGAELFDPGSASPSHSIDSCPTDQATLSPVLTPFLPPASATVATPPPVSTKSGDNAGEPLRLTGIPLLGSVAIGRLTAIGIVAALVLLALAVALYLWAGRRRRRI